MKNKFLLFFYTFIIFLAVVVPKEIIASPANRLIEKPIMQGVAQGRGTSFSINNSSYLNVILISSENVKVFLKSVPKLISLDIKSDSSDVGSTELTLVGLEANKTYYKYQDSYKNNAVFVSDEQGNYTWKQDLAVFHHIWFVEVADTEFKNSSSLLMLSDVSEPDFGPVYLPSQCSEYGIFDEGSSACTLNKDINHYVEIDSSSFTLDCGGYTINGDDYYYGINFVGVNNVNVKNCIISGDDGIYISSSSKISIENSSISGSWGSIFSSYSSDITFKNNQISSSWDGIYFYYTDNNIFTGNNITGRVSFDNSNSNNFSNNTVKEAVLGCIYLNKSNNNKFVSNAITNSENEGIGFYDSNNNEISKNIISANKYGIDLFDSANNTFTENNIKDNELEGVGLYNSSLINFFDNNISQNGIGFGGYDSNDIKVFHNNFVDNILSVEVYGGIYSFDNGFFYGGNYWSDYSGTDLNSNGIGDSAYVFVGGQDNYPFVTQNGWNGFSKTPVLIVPGITGTEMKKGDELLWADLDRMFTDSTDSFMDLLMFNKDGTPSDSSVYVSNVIGASKLMGANVFDYTDGLINEFKSQGYIEGKDLFTFPYDWRYGVSGEYADGTTNSDLLKSKIDEILKQTGAGKVNVVAHSMGGLIVKKYIENNPNLRNIDKAIFVAVPETGAPKAIKGLVQGDNFGVSFGPVGLSDAEMKKIAENMPGAYDLLPSQTYYNNSGSFVSKIDFGGLFSEPQEIDLNYQGFENYLVTEKGLNAQAFANGKNLHTDSFDNLDLRSYGVDLYAVDGCKTATMTNFLEESYKNIFGKIITNYDRVDFKTGDGTVPIQSSTNLPIDQSKKYYALSGEHSKLLSQDGTRQKIVNLISGSNLPVNSKIVTQDQNQCQLNGKAIIVYSPVDIFVLDEQGHKLGLANGNIINEIPNADFEVWGDHKFIYLPQDSGQAYDINMQGTDTGIYTIKSQNINNSKVISTEVFSNLPVTASLIGKINLSSSSTSPEQSTLSVKQKSTDEPTTILPSAELDELESADVLSPISKVTIEGTIGQTNFYRSSVFVKIEATDDLSGVLNIDYNLDNTGYKKVVGSKANFTVLDEGKHTLTFFSTDKAGNNEQEQVINFNIDKTAPEAVIQFDAKVKDLKFMGIDNISETSAILINDKDDIVVLTDQAGNTTEIKFKDKNRKILMSAKIKSLKYNNVSVDVSKNNMVFLWLYDKNKNLKMLSQSVTSKKNYNVLAVYDGKNTKIIGRDSSGKIAQTFSGLKIIKVTTNKGDLSWSY